MMAPQSLEMMVQVVDWKLFGAWLDTEGSISSIITRMKKSNRTGLKRAHELAVYQDEKEVLELLRDFLIRSGIPRPYLYRNQKTGVWALKIYRPEDIERIIYNVEPFILTQKKKLQIEKFRRFRSEKYKRFPRATT